MEHDELEIFPIFILLNLLYNAKITAPFIRIGLRLHD
jgi:hypothetical protein